MQINGLIKRLDTVEPSSFPFSIIANMKDYYYYCDTKRHFREIKIEHFFKQRGLLDFRARR